MKGTHGVNHADERSVHRFLATQVVASVLEENFGDVSEPFAKGRDTAFFWIIPKADADIMNGFLQKCLHLTQATRVGSLGPSAQDEKLELVYREGGKYVNIDPTNVEGIQRGVQLGLGRSGIVDVIHSSFLHEAGSLFNRNNPGKIFTLFHHPVPRAFSIFCFIKHNTNRAYFPAFNSSGYDAFFGNIDRMTFEQYSKSNLFPENWMTRFLLGEKDAILTQRHVSDAKEIMRKKFLIGLTNRVDESLDRFVSYFGWESTQSAVEYIECKKEFITHVSTKWPAVEDSNIWNIIMEKNEKDIQLYAYATELFEEQRSMFR